MNILLINTAIAACLTLLGLSLVRYTGAFAFLLLAVIPVPLLIHGLVRGLIPAALGMSLVAFTTSIILPKSTYFYVFALALPSLGLLFLTLMGNLGRLVFFFPLALSLFASVLTIIYFGMDAKIIEGYISANLDQIFATPLGAEYAKLKDFFVAALPPSTIFFWCLLFFISLYISMRFTKKMTTRFNTDLATLKLPRIAAGALGLAYLVSFFSSSLHINMLAAALSVGFILQALAVLHHVTRGKKWRTSFLVVFYLVSTFILGGISHIALLLFGLADVIFNFRNLKD